MKNKWQPIETAPKDGTMIDLWLGDEEFPRREVDCSFREPTDGEYWSRGTEFPEEHSPEEGLYNDEAGWFDCFGNKLQPTHWMPLPQPPKEDK